MGIADVFNIFGQWAFIHPKDAYGKSKALLQKALELDNSLSELYASLAFITMGYEWDFGAAEKHLRRSIELNPHNAYAHGWYASLLSTVGKPAEALAEAQLAIESDPLFSLVHAVYGVVLVYTGQVERGREQLLKAIIMEPDQPMPFIFLGMVYLVKPAVPEKAIEYLEKAADFGLTFALGWLGPAYAMAGRREDALRILERLEKVEKERFISPLKKCFIYLKPGLRHFRFLKKKYVSPLLKALVYMSLNMTEQALQYFEKACQNRDYVAPMFIGRPESLLDFPGIGDIRSHPRFKALQEKIKIA